MTQQVEIKYNVFPDSLKEKLKGFKLEEGQRAVVEMLRKRTATEVIAIGPGTNEVRHNMPVRGSEYILKTWRLSWEGDIVLCSFWLGNNPAGDPIFTNPSFTNGYLYLSGDKPEDQLIYKLLHIHPHMEGSLNKTDEEPRFKIFNEVEEAKKELEALALKDRALDYLKTLNDIDAKAAAKALGYEPSNITLVKAHLRKMVEQNPQRLLNTKENIERTHKEMVIENAFTLDIIECNTSLNQVVWSRDKSKIADFSLHSSDQKTSFIQLLLDDKSSLGDKVYKEIRIAVNATLKEDATEEKVSKVVSKSVAKKDVLDELNLG